jgi:hypothetical protein
MFVKKVRNKDREVHQKETHSLSGFIVNNYLILN